MISNWPFYNNNKYVKYESVLSISRIKWLIIRPIGKLKLSQTSAGMPYSIWKQNRHQLQKAILLPKQLPLSAFIHPATTSTSSSITISKLLYSNHGQVQDTKKSNWFNSNEFLSQLQSDVVKLYYKEKFFYCLDTLHYSTCGYLCMLFPAFFIRCAQK